MTLIEGFVSPKMHADRWSPAPASRCSAPACSCDRWQSPRSGVVKVSRENWSRGSKTSHAWGQHEVWLLTTTAQRFFERSGYERVSREDVPDEVRMCKEFTILCPSTAVCMRKQSTQCAAPMTERPKTF